MADREPVAHLLRRATFGPTPAEVDTATSAGFDATLNSLVAPVGVDPGATATPQPTLGVDAYDTLGKNRVRTPSSGPGRPRGSRSSRCNGGGWAGWCRPTHQLTEKMVFFWHGHWATSVQKVKSGPLMLRQLDTLRGARPGRLRGLRQGDAARPGADRLAGRPAQHPPGAEREPGPRADGAVHPRHRRLHRGRHQGRRAGADRLDRRPGHRRDQPGSRTATTPARKTILGQTANFDVDSYADLLVGQPATRLLPRRAGCGSGSPPATLPPTTAAAPGRRVRHGRDVTRRWSAAVFADDGVRRRPAASW